MKLVIDLKKEAPPVRSGPGTPSLVSALEEVLGKLAADPQEWYRIGTYKRPSTAVSAVNRLRKQLPTFQWLARGGLVYGRYVGQENGRAGG